MKRVHFVGIGGIGLSGIVKMLLKRGYIISGSDRNESYILDELRALGVTITVPHSREAISNQDTLIYSAVINLDNVEIAEAHRRGLDIYSRKEFLSKLFTDHKVYSVCGANGKSTTTAILASIVDSKALIGAYSKEFNSNYRDKDSDIIVFETDESDGSLISFESEGVILINASFEHMDYYNYDKDLFLDTYRKYLKNAKLRVVNSEDEFINSIKDIECVRLYPSKDITDLEYSLNGGNPCTIFRLKDYGLFSVYGFGYHIALDASLAILLSIELGYDIDTIRENIKRYKGVVKRFDIVSHSSDLVIIDDYAHNPEEIEATFDSIKLYKKFSPLNRVITIWQPHKYSRLISNLDRFKESFSSGIMDELIILPVYNVSEDVLDIDMASEFRNYNPLFATHVKRLSNCLQIYSGEVLIKSISNGIVVGFGAGDITKQLREIH